MSPGCCFAFDAVLYSSPSQVSNSKKFVRILSELNYEIYLFKLSFRNVLFEVYASIRGEEKYNLYEAEDSHSYLKLMGVPAPHLCIPGHSAPHTFGIYNWCERLRTLDTFTSLNISSQLLCDSRGYIFKVVPSNITYKFWSERSACASGQHLGGHYFGPSGVRGLPLAAGINVGGHYKLHFCKALSQS